MRRLPVLLLLLCSAVLASAAAIDGKWLSELKMPAGKKGGEARTVQMTLDLKSDGNKLAGTVSIPGRRRTQTMDIRDGKVDGNKFSFTTVQQTRKGENKLEWRGSVEGGQLTGTRGREGARRGQPFTAKRQS
jgi:hypothetical protein